MRLREIFMEALGEQELPDSIEFPNQNFIVSINRPQRKLIFSPEGHSSLPNKIRTMINMLKQNFRVLKVNSLADEDDRGQGDTDDPNLRGVFAVDFDPRVDFEAAIDFLKNQMDKERE